MAYQTPLSRVEGLGSAHSGVEHFWRQRVTAAALIPLSCWLGVSMLSLVGASREQVLTFLHAPVSAILMVLFVISAVIHMQLGIQVVIEDYVHHDGNKIVLLVLNKAFAWAVGAASLFAMYRIAL
ncbi:MAG: succinate dehydrogenase, hydrophobic membrane anchor protein [Alphaproteobacteria bacterium]|nr:succinate dehydrogenase, hydrophobic membrane anchor protein [Alphaproteobacteria bacterium]